MAGVKFDTLLKVIGRESQVYTELQLSQECTSSSITTGVNYKNEEDKHKGAAPNKPSSSTNPVHQPVMSDDDDGLDGYQDLYLAARNGDWKAGSTFLKKNPEAITKVIASHSRTVLHVATVQGNLMFIKEIVKLMPPEILEYRTSNTGYTALHCAALCGYAKAAEMLVNKNSKLTQMEDRSRRIPLVLALISVTGRQRGTVEYLYSVTRLEHPSPFIGYSLLGHSIDAGFYDIASSLVHRFPELVIDRTKKIQTSAMNNMAERPFAFASGAKHTIWQRCIYPLVKVDINIANNGFNIQTNVGSSKEKAPPENSGNTKRDEWDVIGAAMISGAIAGPIMTVGAIICSVVCLILLLSYFIIKCFFAFLVFRVRFIIPWSPVVKMEKRSDESHLESLEGTNIDEENPIEIIERSCEKKPPEKLENAEGDKAEDIIYAIIFLVPVITCFVTVGLLCFGLFQVYHKEKKSDKSLPQSSEGTSGSGDEENLVEGFEKSCTDERTTPPENSENTPGDKAEQSKLEIVILRYVLRTHEIFAVIPYSILYMIKVVLVFLLRFIRSPGTRIKQLYKHFYDDKVKHKQAEALVMILFKTLKERMNEEEVIEFLGQSNVMKIAIRHGSVEIVEVCIKLFPYLIWTQIGGQNMIQMAIAERNETILDLICKESGKNKIDLVSRCDDKDNTILHYAAKLAPSDQLNLVSGAYLQMQREKQWFKGVENMMPEKDRYKRNGDGDTAHNIFTKEHKELKESGEKWLKDTSGSCMVVAALIATVSFASAFTVPGGNISGNSDNSKNGFPVFLKKDSFLVFVAADAMALLSAITSVLMFLAVYTSRYAEVDFLMSLPNKLILGLTTLFISMASVLVAFGASLFIVLGERITVLIPIVVFSCVPVTFFACLQLPLLFYMIRSTYWGSLFREHTYISSLQLNSKEENHYKKLSTFVDGFGNYLATRNFIEKLVSKKFHPLANDG